ncbi:MAG: hypothetical protein OER83_05480 [Flavobacteriaceae bacterium]|nr:hypothetical protein [Flavobacteriaceae bacterium]MDH3796304.1 hypothetical protein [Flavobacteriaceae bacterium]
MKSLLTTLFLAILLVSCNTSGKSENKDQSSAEGDSGTPAITSNEESPDLEEINTDEALIATALMAAPKESRDGCTVIGFNMAGEFVTLKEGSNDLICLADDPKRDGFNAACYHKDMEPFMARGRELRAEGKTAGEIFNIREEEAKSGKLPMGKAGSTLHIYYGKSNHYDPETSVVDGAKYRYVVYMPWATSESTGLPEKPIAPNHPWIMNPGTHRAHIMISPKN